MKQQTATRKQREYKHKALELMLEEKTKLPRGATTLFQSTTEGSMYEGFSPSDSPTKCQVAAILG